jgi:uncharacterized membrane protein
MIELFGHFHPVIVHLPIGILIVALLLQWLSRKEKYAMIRPVIAIVLFWGSIAAIVACITGYLLSISDDYDQSLVNWHMWMAIGVVLVSLVSYTKEINPKVEVSKTLLSVSLLVLITATGHFGGSLTHGSDYLIKPFNKIFSADSIAEAAIKPLANVQEALAYDDVIKPILQTRCYSCHNENKQKGKLRMDGIEFLLKGGKHGRIIDFNHVDSSHLIQRLLLPVDNEHHMPPKEKPQPLENQVALLYWWISNKADFKKKVKDLNQPDKIKPVLLALQRPAVKKMPDDMPVTPIEMASEKDIEQIRKAGFVVLPVAQNSNYLSVDLDDTRMIGATDFSLLKKISKQLVSLKINKKQLSQEHMSILSTLSALRRLNLANTNLDNNGLVHLNNLHELQHLNLVGTKVTSTGIMQLQHLKKLRSLYLYQTQVNNSDLGKLKAVLPATTVEIGNYIIPVLQTDTTLVRSPQVK